MQHFPFVKILSDIGVLYVADFGHAGILAVRKDGNQELVVGVYEDKPLKGPNSIYLSNGDIFFTDSGTFGETGLQSATGSLFAISNSPSGKILKPISLANLAYPSGVAVSSDGKFMYDLTLLKNLCYTTLTNLSCSYVAEMMANRVLRFFQQPTGVYHGSVFYQLSGAVGPSCLAVDQEGNVYVGQFDVKESASEGSVLILSSAGKLKGGILHAYIHI